MAHQPIQFGPEGEGNADLHGAEARGNADPADLSAAPADLDLKKDVALTIRWNDGRVSVYPIAYLRRHSPSAEAKAVRDEMAKNPLTVLPTGSASGPLTATDAELVGHYALRIEFSDGHRTGLFTWPYLREIDPGRPGDPGAIDRRVRP